MEGPEHTKVPKNEPNLKVNRPWLKIQGQENPLMRIPISSKVYYIQVYSILLLRNNCYLSLSNQFTEVRIVPVQPQETFQDLHIGRRCWLMNIFNHW